MNLHYRRQVLPADPAQIEALVHKTGFFNPEEISIARELAEEHLATGEQSGYFFIFAEDLYQESAGIAAYACFGPIPGTRASFDLYWIVVDPARQGRGLGRALLVLVEEQVRCLGGTRLYIDTSSRAQYAPTCMFYQRCGYRQEAHLPDFYAPDDGKIIFCKVLAR